jgi:hypothetical protein
MGMSAKGADLVRRYLWNAAKSAMQFNPAVRELYARLRSRGTRGDVAMGHCMRKLLHQVYGVWASDQPYNEAASMPRQAVASSVAARSASSCSADPQAPLISETQTAAGHKRASPQREVVTAAAVNVARPAPKVKEAPASGSIDYAFLREQITLEQVLRHLGHFDGLRGRGAQLYGPCPFHTSTRVRSRSFSVNLKSHVFRCCHPTCGVQGNALDLWAAARHLPLYEAALDLAQTFHLKTQRSREEATRNLESATGSPS